jgi:Protein of unknown function (DUF1592)/Protein of unknown function (DUF1588)/Protein of unknown function (DUF1587)/Protein of unknown function (DUF1595)/Protein of unknown function (DUF1585)
MRRLGIATLVLWALATVLSAQNGTAPKTPAATIPTRRIAAVPAAAPDTFRKFCFECHAGAKPEAGLSIEALVGQPGVAGRTQEWEKVAEMLETGAMPPLEASAFPLDAERAAAVSWIRSSLKAYETAHAGEPGHVTVRRLTSGEYAYAIRDLTGIDIPVGIDASSDSVGGEGFTNFGDVQFVEDASIERYLEAAKVVADHAVIGAGPLDFYADPGKTGLELFALNRLNDLYASKGFRVVSGEGGRPFGLDRYGKAFYVTWYYKHRVALGDASATLRGLAGKEGITARFAEHVWTVLNVPNHGYPTREMVNRWKQFAAPNSNKAASIAKARASSDDLYKYLTTWPSWFFARGDIAAGGAGDESPLVFDDSSLKVVPERHFIYPLASRAARGRGTPTPAGPTKVYLTFSNLNPTPGARPVVVFRDARVVTRAAGGPARGAAGAAAGAATPPGGRSGPIPVLSSQPLRAVLAPDAASALKFGTSPDASVMGANDFAITDTVSFEVPAAATGTTMEFQADAQLGADKNGVVRLMVTDRPEGSSRDANQRVLIGDGRSAGYKTFRAGMDEYASLLPPNSNGEANPADKDPVPLPFDSTFNTPEHDAFVLKVKYQRNDAFFTANMVDRADRARLNQAWTDLVASFPYHDAYLDMLADHFSLTLKSRHIEDMGGAEIAALPASVRQYVIPLRADYDHVVQTMKLAEPGHVEDALTFASRAWRRPLTVPEKTSLRAFYGRARTDLQLDHDGAMRALLTRVLVSPEFLYRVETVAAGAEKPLNNWELASRLSFFLWSSIPDDELRRVAATGTLGSPDVLAKQVRRMTADPKARRIATEFFGQWLGFYRFDQYRGVDTGRFPEFTDVVKASMYDESVSTFEYIVRQGRPIQDMLYADYTFLNDPLAKFYGIDKKIGSANAVVKVDGANALNRGGVLRMGTMLATTSAPLRTSPVKRGDWVLRRILGTPTPPPPPDAGSIPADDKSFEGLTLRQKLTQHKRNATCANCHLRIDPLGFPLEGFDAVGRPRTTYADGNAVDVTGEFADKSTIIGTDGLLKYLHGKDAQVMKTLSKKMLGYALGRTVLASDQRLVSDMVAAGGTATFADLAIKIVSSRQFRYRQGQTEDTSAPKGRPAGAGVTAMNRPSSLRAGTP